VHATIEVASPCQ